MVKRTLAFVVFGVFALATGPNPLEVPGRQQIGLEMNQWDVQVGYTFRLGGR